MISTRIATVLFVLVACNPDDGEDDEDAETGTTSTGSADSSSSSATSTDPTGEAGLLGCPAGESCTILIVSEALDDRVEFFTARGSTPTYRGAIDLDLKPNPGGNNEGENLDEPFGLELDENGLSVLVGHYPARDQGSLVVFPYDLLAMHELGSTIAQGEFFADGAFTSAVGAVELGEEEPIFMRTHSSGRLLIVAFENDLFALESEWTAPGKLLVVDPADPGTIGVRTLDDVGGSGCAGAWSIVALDADNIAISCDGDDGAAVLDVSGIGEGSVQDAAAAVNGCIADIFMTDRRVRAIAPDGDGGFILASHSTVPDLMDGDLWHYSSDCEVLGVGTLPGALFEIRQILKVSRSDQEPRWLMTSGLTDERGVHVVRDGATGPEVCAKLGGLDAFWTADDGGQLEPYALAYAHTQAGAGLAITAGPREPADDQPGSGRVLWAEIDAEADPCTETMVGEVTDLTASAPAVDPGDPATWRRGPNVVLLQHYGP